MSQNESFIEEVTEEVRRERLYAFIRRWFWLAILLIVVIVGLAAWNEWRKARETARAEALGDAVLAALAAEDPAARAEELAQIAVDDEASAFVTMLAATEAAGTESGTAAAVALSSLAERGDLVPRWRDLADLKLILLESEDMPGEERIAQLEPLTAAGSPYRLLALEATALALVDAGQTSEAVAILRDILADDRVTEGLRTRASQLIVALEGDPAAG